MIELSSHLERWANFRPGVIAVRHHDTTLTYADLVERVRRLSGSLAQLGIRRGDRIAYYDYNHPDYLVTLFAACRLGAALVPVNWRLAAPEVLTQLGNADVAAIIGDPELVSSLEPSGGGLPGVERCIASGARGGLATCVDELVAGAAADPGRQGDPSDPALIVYTSGTTGTPKGAVLTQSALSANAVNSVAMHDLTSADEVLTVLPLFHVGGLNIQTVPALLSGATVTLHDRFEPGAWLDAVGTGHVSLSVLVPATMQAVIEHDRWASTDLSSLRLLTTGSSIVPVPLIEAFHERGIPVCQVYGATETAPIATHQRADDALATIGTAGHPAMLTDIRVVANDGDCPAGEPGEVWIRGANVFTGYWNNDDATRESLREGWFRSGDIGYLDDDGRLSIVDRKKDVIISGGENIYPAELEQVLARSSLVADAVVVGRPDPRWGEIPVAVIVRPPGVSAETADILMLFDGTLARYKHPRAVVFVDELPRNAMGKVLKTHVRDAVAAHDPLGD